jgi:hypothetical protein
MLYFERYLAHVHCAAQRSKAARCTSTARHSSRRADVSGTADVHVPPLAGPSVSSCTRNKTEQLVLMMMGWRGGEVMDGEQMLVFY